MQKIIVVTGGAGFIGSHLCERLHNEGHRVISLDNYSAGHADNHINGVTYINGHTKNIEALINEPVDLIFHLGEYARVEQSFDDIKTVHDFNTVGTFAVLEFARKQECKIVYSGSSTKFADGGIGRDQSPYAWTKATNTELVRNYGEWFGVPYAITYFYNAYGPRERGDYQTGTLIAIYKKKYDSSDMLQVRLPGTQRRNFTHVSDIVDGLMLVGERGDGDEYGLGHPDSYSVREVAEMFNSTIEEVPERMGNRMDSAVDTRRASLELGWKPKLNLPDYIKELL
jgi:UDP-glucose 4-epimerase